MDEDQQSQGDLSVPSQPAVDPRKPIDIPLDLMEQVADLGIDADLVVRPLQDTMYLRELVHVLALFTLPQKTVRPEDIKSYARFEKARGELLQLRWQQFVSFDDIMCVLKDYFTVDPAVDSGDTSLLEFSEQFLRYVCDIVTFYYNDFTRYSVTGLVGLIMGTLYVMIIRDGLWPQMAVVHRNIPYMQCPALRDGLIKMATTLHFFPELAKGQCADLSFVPWKFILEAGAVIVDALTTKKNLRVCLNDIRRKGSCFGLSNCDIAPPCWLVDWLINGIAFRPPPPPCTGRVCAQQPATETSSQTATS